MNKEKKMREELEYAIKSYSKDKRFGHFDLDGNEVECNCKSKPACQVVAMNYGYEKATNFWVKTIEQALCRTNFDTFDASITSSHTTK